MVPIDNLLISLSCVTPLFVTMLIGVILSRSKLVPSETFRHLSTITFHALLPCLVFDNVYKTDLSTAFQPKLLSFIAVFIVGWYIINYIFLSSVQPDPRKRGALIQNCYRSNFGVIGISLAQNMMGPEGVASAAMAVSIIVPLYNLLGIFTLETCRGGKPNWKHTIFNILRNPMILGSILGFLFHLFQIRLPVPLERAVSNLSTSASVLALLSLGGSFTFFALKKNLHLLILGCIHRLILTPFVAIVIAILLGFRDDNLGVILVCMASPLAVASYAMSIAYDSDHELTSQLVVTSSLLCSLTLFLWIFALKQLGLI